MPQQLHQLSEKGSKAKQDPAGHKKKDTASNQQSTIKGNFPAKINVDDGTVRCEETVGHVVAKLGLKDKDNGIGSRVGLRNPKV